MAKKYYRTSKLARLLEKKDNCVGDFDEIPRVSLTEDCDDEVFDLDMRCTDMGDAMDFFN